MMIEIIKDGNVTIFTLYVVISFLKRPSLKLLVFSLTYCSSYRFYFHFFGHFLFFSQKNEILAEKAYLLGVIMF